MREAGRRSLGTGAFALVAAAASLPGAAVAEEWRYNATLYGWLTSLSATVGTPLGTVEVEQSFSDVFDQLDYAVFGTFEARRGTWGLIGDLAHANLSRTESFLPTAPFGAARIDTRLTALSGYAVYRIVETGTVGVDVGAGLRYYDLSLRMGLTGPSLDIRRTDSWADPIIGARAVWDIGDGWRGAIALDAGGFGIGNASDLSWQAVAELEYGFSDRWSVLFGYRHLSIDRPIDGREMKLELSGPLIGVRARF